MKYVNTGAPIPRGGKAFGEGTEFVDTGSVFEPTAEEVRRLGARLRPATAEEIAATESSAPRVDTARPRGSSARSRTAED